MQWCCPVGAADGSAAAVGVYETGCGAFVRFACPPDGDRVVADRLAGGREPLFPLARVLWFTVGVQQQAWAERASAALDSQEPQHGRAHPRWSAAASPQGPVFGQARIVRG